MNRMLDQNQIAERFGVARQTLGRWITEGRFPPATNDRRRGKLWDEAVVNTFELHRDTIVAGLDIFFVVIQQPGIDAGIRAIIEAAVSIAEDLSIALALRARVVETAVHLLNANNSPKVRAKFTKTFARITAALCQMTKRKSAADELTSALDAVSEKWAG